MASELQVNTITEATSGSGITFAKDIIPATPLSHRNMIINGAMNIAQRGTSVTDVNQVSTYFNADRWKHWESISAGQYQTSLYSMSTAEQNTTGHTKAIKLNVKNNNAVSSLGAGEYAFVGTILEGQDLQHLQYGTANAKTITLSFWVKSNKTGTYVLNLNKADSTVTRVPMEYTINTANTWEKKTITITPTQGSTSLITASGGAIANDNGIGFEILWVLAVGSTFSGGTANTWSANVNHISTSNQVNWMDTDTNDFYLTGVQLELGSVATPFEHRTYQDELRRCQRYYYKIISGANAASSDYNDLYQNYLNIIWYSSTNARGLVTHPVTMRVNPSFSANGNYQTIPGTDVSSSSFSAGDYGGTPVYSVRVATNGTTYQGTTIRSKNDSTAYFAWDAEL